MNNRMFCFQCEQTAGGTGCTDVGVCGKAWDTAKYQDRLTGAVISLSDCIKLPSQQLSKHTIRLIYESLFATVTNTNFDNVAIVNLIDRIHEEGYRLCSKRTVDDFDINTIWKSHEDVKSIKSLMLFGLRGIAAYAFHAAKLDYYDNELNSLVISALQVIAHEEKMEMLISGLLDVGRANYICMKLLYRANTETYGVPVPTEVTHIIESGPFIVVSGHDLNKLNKILSITDGIGINVYTHGEMLPAHGYPELKSKRNLKGHFGTAWQNQKKEFDKIPAPVVFTSNCLMPPDKSYIDRVFVPAPVGYPGIHEISEDRDYSILIKRAMDLGGYDSKRYMTGINGGDSMVTGWSYRALLLFEKDLVDAIVSGEINHIFIIGGCDGAKPGRNYYTELVKMIPHDSLIFTMGCAKFRFNDLDLGYVAGFPRFIDIGQCNDAYAAIQLMLRLADDLKCGINELPISMVLSWYEQKAISVLLSLLYLQKKDIFIGPSLPACISDNVLMYLQNKYRISLISNPEADLKKMLENHKNHPDWKGKSISVENCMCFR